MDRTAIVDLFSGAGGFSLGAHLAGFSTALAIENDPDLSLSYSENFPHAHLLLGDITKLSPNSALAAAGKRRSDIAGIVGGPPCQGFSVIGRRDPADPRNTLLAHYFRFVRVLKPPFFILENVPGLLDEPFRSLLDAELNSLASYVILGPILVDAADYGAATNRTRVLVIGYRPSIIGPLTDRDLLKAQISKATVHQALSDLPSLERATREANGDWWIELPSIADAVDLSTYARRARSAPVKGLASEKLRLAHLSGRVYGFHPTAHTKTVLQRFRGVVPGGRERISRFPRLRWDCPAPTLRAGTGKDRGSYQAVRPLHPKEDRVITVREAARLQGFPDWFSFHPTRWHSFRMIGNSVSPYVAKAILQLLFKSMRA